MCIVCLYCARFCSSLSTMTYFPASCDFCIGRLFCKEVELIFQWKKDNTDFLYFCPMKQLNMILLFIYLFKLHHPFKRYRQVKHMLYLLLAIYIFIKISFKERCKASGKSKLNYTGI